jgi:hypothetical protein
MMAGVSDELVERLYTAAPDGFVAARAEAVAAARAAGDAAAAREIARLRKPTVAAWLVNLLANRRPELMAELVELSDALRSAQRELRGPQLRELSVQRRAAVNALVGEAKALAVAADPRMTAGKLPLAEVEATLNAAFSDAEVAEQVRSGRLVRAASYAGFGEVPRPQLRLVTGGGTEQEEDGGRGAERPGKGGAAGDRAAARPGRQTGAATAAERDRAAALAGRRKVLDRESAAARAESERAEAELDRAAAAERAGAEELAGIEAELADLERRRAAAEQEVSRRKLARRTAERAVSSARRHAGEVQAAIEALEEEIGAAADGVAGADSGG